MLPLASGLIATRVICSVREVAAGRLAPASVVAKRRRRLSDVQVRRSAPRHQRAGDQPLLVAVPTAVTMADHRRGTHWAAAPKSRRGASGEVHPWRTQCAQLLDDVRARRRCRRSTSSTAPKRPALAGQLCAARRPCRSQAGERSTCRCLCPTPQPRSLVFRRAGSHGRWAGVRSIHHH